MAGYWNAYGKLDGYWGLQESSGTTAIDSIGSRHGQILGGLDPSVDQVSGPGRGLAWALEFDGVDDHISIPFDPTLHGSAYTCFAWAYWQDDSAVYETVWDCRDDPPTNGGHTQYKTNTDRWQHWIGNGSGFPSVGGRNTVAGEWIHLAATYETDRVRFFVNGVEESSLISPYVPNGSSALTIGQRGNGLFPFHGRIAAVGISTQVLSPIEIAEIVAGPEPTNTELPILPLAVEAGQSMVLNSGLWDSHNNGSMATTHYLEQSDDGLTGWSLVPGTTNSASYQVEASLAGKYFRLSALATNDGGTSDVHSSQVVQEGQGRDPLVVPAAGIAVSGGTIGQAAQSGATAGLVITG